MLHRWRDISTRMGFNLYNWSSMTMFSSGLKFRRVWFDFELRILSIFQQLVVCWENFSGEEQPCRSVRCKYMYIFHIKWWNNDETFPFDTSPLHPDRLRSTNMLIVLIFDVLQYFNSSNLDTGPQWHYSDVIMGAMASQITSLTIVYSTVYSDADQWKQQSSASLARVRGIHRWPVNSPHKGPVTRKMFPFGDVILETTLLVSHL